MMAALILEGLVSLALSLMGWAGVSIGGDPRSRIKRQAPFLLIGGLCGVVASVVALIVRL